MDSRKILNKFFIIGLLVFLLINTSSLGLNQDIAPENNRQRPISTIFGKIGDNGWYVTIVTITFEYDPKIVMEIQYYLDDSWHVYTGPIQIAKDGIYSIGWFWKDFDNHIYYELPIIFKIDQTPPTMKLTKKSSGKTNVIFTAATTDTTSEIERVEFYLDDVLIQTDTTSPYQYTWTGEQKQFVYAISYNYAGLLVKSDNLSTTPRSHSRTHNLMDIVFVLMQKIFFRFY
jgi:hypothetical protein